MLSKKGAWGRLIKIQGESEQDIFFGGGGGGGEEGEWWINLYIFNIYRHFTMCLIEFSPILESYIKRL